MHLLFIITGPMGLYYKASSPNVITRNESYVKYIVININNPKDKTNKTWLYNLPLVFSYYLQLPSSIDLIFEGRRIIKYLIVSTIANEFVELFNYFVGVVPPNIFHRG